MRVLDHCQTMCKILCPNSQIKSGLMYTDKHAAFWVFRPPILEVVFACTTVNEINIEHYVINLD